MMLDESLKRGEPIGLLLPAIGKNGGFTGARSSHSTINGTTGDTGDTGEYLYYLIKDCQSAPLGIHRLLEISCADGVAVNPIGRWYAPSEVLSLVKKALKLSLSPLTSDLSLLLAVDGQVVVGDAERESRVWSKRLLLFVPLRLGTNQVNPWNFFVFLPNKSRIQITCLGIIGGKPDHSLYFIGCFGHDVIYLDPHVAQEYVPISVWDRSSLEGEEKKRRHPLCTYHCHSLSKMAMKDMDPSCVVGFMFKSREEMDESFRILNLNQVIDMDLGPGEGSKRTKDPLFSVRYHETPMCNSHQEVTDDERRQALEHGFEML
uniref:Cysteine protease n=1 Tax=Angiostrongylus cantonensis TaxID=6313 RepID=A0A0K0DE34_ANGCA